MPTLTHHNPIGHEEHHPTKDMNHEEGHRQTTQVIIPTAAKDISVTCDRAPSCKMPLWLCIILKSDAQLITTSALFWPPAECSVCSASGPSAPCWFSIASSSLSRRRGVPRGQHGMRCSRYIRKRTATGTGSWRGAMNIQVKEKGWLSQQRSRRRLTLMSAMIQKA